MNHNEYEMISGDDQLPRFDEIIALRKQVWPDFIRVPEEQILKLYQRFPDYQYALLEHGSRKLIAIFNTLPLIWQGSLWDLPDEGVSWAIQTGLNGNYEIELANVLCATSMTVSPDCRNNGISKIFLNHVKNIATIKKYSAMVAAVRPNFKCHYPLIAIEKYVEWKWADGTRFDPWLRVHEMLGAQVLNICKKSATVSASIDDWERWTGINFPGDGSYVIEEALTPLDIRHDSKLGKYVEPNVWVCYPLSSAS